MKDSEIKEYIEAHEDALIDIHAEIEELKIEFKAMQGILNALITRLATIELATS